MKASRKLQFIQRVAGLTQEKLAHKLGVSFPTINSWINEKSVPRKKALDRIDEFYKELTGQKIIKADILGAKKAALITKSSKHKNILASILKRSDIHDQFVLSLTYNTNRIEGSTLTEDETAAVLFDNKSLPNRTLIEQMEAKNHQAALQYLFNHLSNSNKITQTLILKLHSILMNGIRDDAGIYRNHGVRIVGSNVSTSNYLKIPSLMKDLSRNISLHKKDIIAHVSLIHSRFEQIHPFSDGNGRIGRLLIHAMLLNRNFPPAVIHENKKRLYIKYLNKSQLENEFSLLEDFICDAVLDGFSIMKD